MNPSAYSDYSSFGIAVEKDWLFSLGGRPVIYQPESEFALLPPELQWRHMRYEPGTVDFTWEREWRILTDELQFDPRIASIVVPDADFAERLVALHEDEQEFQILQYSQIMDQIHAEQYREAFPWCIYVLNE